MYKFGAPGQPAEHQLPDCAFKTTIDETVRESASALVVGWTQADGVELLKWLKLHGCIWELLEPNFNACEYIKGLPTFSGMVVYNLEYRDFVATRAYDVVLWRPALLSDTEFERQSKLLWVAASKAVVVEVNKNHWSYERMVGMGFEFMTCADGVTAVGMKRK